MPNCFLVCAILAAHFSGSLMKGNVVLASAIFASGIIIASIILVLGVKSALNDAMLHLDATVRTHAKSVEQAGSAVGAPIRSAAVGLTKTIEQADENVYSLQMTIKDPLKIAQPIQVKGPRQDGSLPVNARLAK